MAFRGVSWESSHKHVDTHTLASTTLTLTEKTKLVRYLEETVGRDSSSAEGPEKPLLERDTSPKSVTTDSEGQWAGSMEDRGEYKEVFNRRAGWVKGQGGVHRGSGLCCHC